MHELADEFNANSNYINIYLYTEVAMRDAYETDILSDLKLVMISVGLVCVYCILFMGSCSPIHFRSIVGIYTLFCVIISTTAAAGLGFFLGARHAGIHNLLPFLLLGIGCDDMFVLVTSIDQTDPTASVETRLKVGMMNAGTSVTITSLTNGLAFFLGMTSSLTALQSFCFFAGLGIIFLYISSITIFTSLLVWDIKRQMNQRGDCFGLCCC